MSLGLQDLIEKYMICLKLKYTIMATSKNSYTQKNHDRLAAALRENLRKRKEQIKAKKQNQPQQKKDT